MLKKILNGLLFGFGFFIAMIIIYSIWTKWILPRTIDDLHSKLETEETIYSTTDSTIYTDYISSKERYLGSSGRFNMHFDSIDNYDRVLKSGNGIISGLLLANSEPIEGIKIRLALNGKAFSQWGISDKNGEYRIKVPYGKYRIDGFDLGHLVVDNYLSGLIEHPCNPFESSTFEVNEENIGTGLDLQFVSPVKVISPKGEVSLTTDVIIKWEPYPEAHSYSVQLFETKKDRGFTGNKGVFNWSKKPIVYDSELNISNQGAKLKENYYYEVHITAFNEDGNVISESHRTYYNRNFKVVK